MLFTSVPEVAAELSRMLPAHCPADSQLVLAGFLAVSHESLTNCSPANARSLLLFSASISGCRHRPHSTVAKNA